MMIFFRNNIINVIEKIVSVSHVYSIPTQQNVSYSLVAVKESHLTTSGTPTQVMRSASEDESATNDTYYDVI